MRAFVAVPLPPPLPDEVALLIERLRKGLAFGGPPVGWVTPATMHLTLKFLGARVPEDPATLRRLKDAIGGALAAAAPVELQWGLATALPSLREPRTIVLELVRETRRDLGRLAKAIDAAVVPLGARPDQRDFYPHLTLGRIKNRSGTKIVVDTLRTNGRFSPATVTADRVVLYSSVLRKAGPVHKELFGWNLVGKIERGTTKDTSGGEGDDAALSGGEPPREAPAG
jgi:2'-5' RNA ligase